MGVTIREVRQMLEDIGEDERHPFSKSWIETGQERDDFLQIMLKNLTAEERNVLTLRHMNRNKWDFVAYKMHLSRSNCIRIENRGMEKLRKAWGKYLAGKTREDGGGDK